MKKAYIILLIALVTYIFPSVSKAYENEESILESQTDSLGISTFLSDSKKYTEDTFGNIDIQEIFTKSLSGNLDNNAIIKIIFSLLGNNIKTAITTIASVMVVIIIHSILKAISENLGNENVSKIAYYIEYIVIITLIMTNFSSIITEMKEATQNLVAFANTLIPLMITLMLTTGNIVTRRMLQPILLLLITFILLIILSSNFVWNVEIQVEDNQVIENIEEDLKNSGLEVGKLKSKINTKDIINKVRLSRDDIAWMGIELKGTNAIVKLVKSDEKPEIIDESEYCNIVSNKSGIITKINAQSGSANVKVGDIVNVGDVLINGWMEGKYTGIRYVHAKGDIEAKVWYTKNKKILYNTTEKQETGNIEKKYAIKFNNFQINLSKKLSKFKIYDTIETENKIKIFSNFYLPISIIKITNKEVEEVQKTYELEETKNIGIQELEQELEQEIENKNSIVNKNINTYEDETGVEIYVTYEVIENIGTNEKIVF